MLIVQEILFPLEEDIIRFIVVIPIFGSIGPPFDDDKCKVCLLLPVCGDGCPYNRIKCDTEDTEITNNNIKLIKPI